MTQGIPSPAPTADLPRAYLMRSADALASATAHYAVPLLVLVTTGSTALTGLDLPSIAADVACGKAPDLTPTAHATAAIKILYPPASGVLSARSLAVAPGPECPWLHRVTWLREVGERVVLPPAGDLDTSRIGFLVVTADNPAAARDRLSLLADGLTLSVAR